MFSLENMAFFSGLKSCRNARLFCCFGVVFEGFSELSVVFGDLASFFAILSAICISFCLFKPPQTLYFQGVVGFLGNQFLHQFLRP